MSALAAAPTGAQEGDDLQKEKLFEIPPVQLDKTKATTISVSISGSLELDLSQKADVDFYNELQAGKLVTKETTFFVASTKKTHRRDSEGNVDAVPETKSLVVDGVKIVED